MAIFSHLIQRAEARNMIQTLFLGRTDHDRLAKSGDRPDFIADFVTTTKSVLDEERPSDELLATLGFTRPGLPSVPALRRSAGAGYWLNQSDLDPRRQPALALMQRLSRAVLPLTRDLTAEQLRVADYAVVRELGYPAYLGGPAAFGQQVRES
jgi:3-hydroxyacyl-CoA dehydrogenase/enoyl-CoA hydratase/3-hydroxybutyryl-CoA epimerase